jgi:hypothetical protein
LPIVRPIRDGRSDCSERSLLVAGRSFCVLETDGALLPITVPMFRSFRKLSDERLLFRSDVIEALVGAVRELPLLSEFLVPMELPIREVMLGLIRLFVLLVERFVITLLELLKFKLLLLVLLKFKLLLLELLILEVPLLELSTGRLTVLLNVFLVPIELPIREVMLGLIRLFVLLVDLFVIVFRELLLNVFLVPIELPIREVMLGLILLFELLGRDVEELLCGRVTVLRLLMPTGRLAALLRLDEVEFDEFDRNIN